jgi:glycosyltransferase involved in cell wall biosynthesis
MQNASVDKSFQKESPSPKEDVVTKRILYIIPSLDRAGAEKQMSILAAGLPRDEFDVSVCALTRGGPMLDDLRRAGVPVTVIGKRWRADPLAYWLLQRHMARLQPDLVHTWLFAGNAYGRAAALSCGVKRIVAGERCVDPWKGWLELAIDRRLARRTDRIVANSPAVRDFYTARGLPADRFEVIPNAVPPAPASRLDRRQLLQSLGISEGSRLVGLVGRLWPQKRVKDAIWAADLLKVVRNDIHLLIVGDGPQRARLHTFRDQVRIADKVHFLGHRNDVPDLLPHFDVLWSTSGYEGQSNAILEAMACGVPVVASDIPGTRDLVLHGETGYLVAVGDRAAFAKFTNRLVDDSKLAEQVGRAARPRAASPFSPSQLIDRHAALYRQLLGDVS